MKTGLAIALIVGITSTWGMGQSYRFGIKTGVVFSGFSQQEQSLGNSDFEWEGYSSYTTGIFFNRKLKEAFSIQAELDYKTIGASTSSPLFLSGSTINYEHEYIGLSIMPRLDLFPESRFNPNFMIGPGIDFRTHSEIEIFTEGEGPVFTEGFLGVDSKPYTNKAVFGLVMAGGVEINTKPVIITLETRYTSYIGQAFEESIENLQLDENNVLLKLVENAKTEYLSILIGFNFYF